MLVLFFKGNRTQTFIFVKQTKRTIFDFPEYNSFSLLKRVGFCKYAQDVKSMRHVIWNELIGSKYVVGFKIVQT